MFFRRWWISRESVCWCRDWNIFLYPSNIEGGYQSWCVPGAFGKEEMNRWPSQNIRNPENKHIHTLFQLGEHTKKGISKLIWALQLIVCAHLVAINRHQSKQMKAKQRFSVMSRQGQIGRNKHEMSNNCLATNLRWHPSTEMHLSAGLWMHHSALHKNQWGMITFFNFNKGKECSFKLLQ